MKRNELYPKGNGLWEADFETDEGKFCVRVPDATLRRHYEEALERLGIPTDKPDELIKAAERLRDRQRLVWLQVQEIDYWRQCGDPEAHIFQWYYPAKGETPE